MKNEALKRISEELATTLKTWASSTEVREVIEKTKKASPEDTGTFEVVITTENLDRYQEVIKLDGWETELYMMNPVVLWGHDHDQLIGITTSLEKRDGKLIAKGKFAPTEFAQEKRRLYDLGFLRATSVGFIEKEREGNLITKAELLEFSFVSVPANPYALSLALEKGLSINELVTKGIFTIKTVDTPPEEETAVTDDSVPSQEVIEEETGEEVEETSTEGEGETREGDNSVDNPADAVDAGEEETEETEEETDNAGEAKHFNKEAVKAHIASLKEQIVALEELVKDEEPEGNDAAQAESEEEKRYKEFSEKRKAIQLAATILDDVLAEARRAIEAKK